MSSLPSWGDQQRPLVLKATGKIEDSKVISDRKKRNDEDKIDYKKYLINQEAIMVSCYGPRTCYCRSCRTNKKHLCEYNTIDKRVDKRFEK